jgi:hypothetical protein
VLTARYELKLYVKFGLITVFKRLTSVLSHIRISTLVGELNFINAFI